MTSAKPVPSISMKASVPHQVRLAVPMPCSGSSRQVGDDAVRCRHASSSGVPFGQNQPISATAIGTAPQTTAQGVKIEADQHDASWRSRSRAARSNSAATTSRACGRGFARRC